MEEGTILRWLKADGEHVARGEQLVEIETDKAALIYESDQEGTLSIVAAEGSTHPVGAVIAYVGEPAASCAASPAAPVAACAPAERRAPIVHGRARRPPTGAARPRRRPARVKASPIARRIARRAASSSGHLQGSGPGGRIVRRDVEGADPEPRRRQARPRRRRAPARSSS